MNVLDIGSTIFPLSSTGCGPIYPLVVSISVGNHPSALARHRRVWEPIIEPRCEHLHNPQSLGRDRRVRREHYPASLVHIGRSHSAHQEADLRLRKLRRLIDCKQIVRLPLPVLLAAYAGRGAQFDKAAIR
jgi:hypothetical protein